MVQCKNLLSLYRSHSKKISRGCVWKQIYLKLALFSHRWMVKSIHFVQMETIYLSRKNTVKSLKCLRFKFCVSFKKKIHLKGIRHGIASDCFGELAVVAASFLEISFCLLVELLLQEVQYLRAALTTKGYLKTRSKPVVLDKGKLEAQTT